MHFRTPLGLGLGLRLKMQLNANRNPNPNPRGVRKCTSALLSNRLWKNNRTVHVNEQNKKLSTSHSIDHKQCNGTIKGWLHCLTTESIVRFLVNILVLNMSGREENPNFFNRKNKDWTFRTLATQPPPPPPPRPITSHFCLNPLPTPQSGRHMYRP